MRSSLWNGPPEGCPVFPGVRVQVGYGGVWWTGVGSGADVNETTGP